MLPQPSPLASQASMTSSGFADGLGRRTLAFDREEGVMLERLVLRPELGAFESMLRDRLDSLGTLEDERIARPRTIERGGLSERKARTAMRLPPAPEPCFVSTRPSCGRLRT